MHVLCVDIQNYSRHHINAVVQISDCPHPWKFIGFYRHPEVGKQKESWSLLKLLHSFTLEALLCVGYLNEITVDSEKYGTTRRPLWQMVDFRKALDYTNLTDLGFKGPKFTWLNMQDGSKFIKERLDRALGNSKWLDFFQMVKVNVLAACTSDHAPLLITFQHLVQQRLSRRFWYDARWGKILAYKEVIKKEWIIVIEFQTKIIMKI